MLVMLAMATAVETPATAVLRPVYRRRVSRRSRQSQRLRASAARLIPGAAAATDSGNSAAVHFGSPSSRRRGGSHQAPAFFFRPQASGLRAQTTVRVGVIVGVRAGPA